MYRTALSIALLGLAGCSTTANLRADRAGFFDAPTAADKAAERESCYRSALCRTVIGQPPPVLYTALNSNRICIEHAFEAARLLEGVKGVERMRVMIGSKNPRAKQQHAVLQVTYEGRDYIIDQGGLGYNPGRMPKACLTASECGLEFASRQEASVCPDGVCEARDGLFGFVATDMPIKVWPEREGLASNNTAPM